MSDTMDYDLDLSLTVDFDFVKPAQMRHDYQGYPGHIAINTLLYKGIELPSEITRLILEEHEEGIQEQIIDTYYTKTYRGR